MNRKHLIDSLGAMHGESPLAAVQTLLVDGDGGTCRLVHCAQGTSCAFHSETKRQWVILLEGVVTVSTDDAVYGLDGCESVVVDCGRRAVLYATEATSFLHVSVPRKHTPDRSGRN